MAVRRVTRGEWPQLRELRLAALRDAPDAFKTTLTEAEGEPEEAWREWAERSATSDQSAVFVDDAFGGMAGGYVEQPGIVVLFGMWVEPSRRGTGLAEALVDAVAAWA